MMAPPMAGRKDPRRALQRVPMKDLTTASRMVPLRACLKAHSRELLTASRIAFFRAPKMVGCIVRAAFIWVPWHQH